MDFSRKYGRLSFFICIFAIETTKKKMKFHKKWMLLLLSMVTLTITAQENVPIQQRGCRRGYGNSQTASARQAIHTQSQSTASTNPYIGDRRQLVVLAAFSDSAFSDNETATLEKWNLIFNQEHYNEDKYTGSLHDYFYDQSYGQLRLSFDLHYLTLGKRSRYASNNVDDENSQYLVNDIVDSLQKRDIDWSLYDWEGDGYINQLLIVCSGRGMNDGGDQYTVWPHQYWLSLHVDPTTEENCEARTVVDSDGKSYLIDCYCAVNELGRTKNTFGTICHEYSHCLGLPDFYSNTKSYVGSWDLMDSGNYNGNGYTPSGYSAHERWLMGWLKPKELTESTMVSSMQALSDKGEAYLIRNDNCDNEYYIVENRQPTGWDASLPGSGIVVFHIDYDEELWKSIEVFPNDRNRSHYVIIPANNRSSTYYSSGWAYPYNNNNELSNTSTPAARLWQANTDGTYNMNKALTYMAVNDSLASFHFSPIVTLIASIPVDKSASDNYYNLAGQCIDNPTRGFYIKNGKKYVK